MPTPYCLLPTFLHNAGFFALNGMVSVLKMGSVTLLLNQSLILDANLERTIHVDLGAVLPIPR
jgi:hypothetical protein